MTDEEAARMVPVVNEFVAEVGRRDKAGVWACLEHTSPDVLAVLCAELLFEARKRLTELERVEAAYVRQRHELMAQRARVVELREIIYERKAA